MIVEGYYYHYPGGSYGQFSGPPVSDEFGKGWCVVNFKCHYAISRDDKTVMTACGRHLTADLALFEPGSFGKCKTCKRLAPA